MNLIYFHVVLRSIESGGDDVDRREDRMAMAAILRSVPDDIISALTSKKSAWEMWESIDRVCEVGGTTRRGVRRRRKSRDPFYSITLS